MAPPKKKKKKIAGKILKKVLLPHHLFRIFKLQRQKKKNKKQRVNDDAQLLLYSRILPSGFLHYGYFKNPDIAPADISLNMVEQAQLDYALELVNLAQDKTRPVLDIGCGMGGLVRVLREQGFAPVALTPDVNQVKYVREKYPQVEVIEGKFEDMPLAGNEKKFGTLITSESLQYLDLDRALPLMNELLTPGGKWIACDYFRIGEAVEKSGHNWELFTQKINKAGWKITYERDITPNILPTIAYAHMWGTRLGLPLKDFIISKMKVKQPGLYYILEDVIPGLEESIDKNLKTIDPVLFRNSKKYVLLVMERI